MEKENMNLVIAGHVDHGKSTLIGRLLFDTNSLPDGKIQELKKTCKELGHNLEFAFIMDSLQEEVEQGMTIDTAQTFFKTSKRDYTIIDAPGHKEFVKNMITGASQAETAILIIDVNDGVKEQTKRHAYILSMLGIKQLVVVLNKMDLVNYNEKKFNEVKTVISNFLDSLKIKPLYFIPIVAKDGDNVAKASNKMKWYSGKTLLQGLDSFHVAESLTNRSLRLPVQDVYEIDGKPVLVGYIESGKLKPGEEVMILPSNKAAKINSIESFLTDKKEAEAGESIGITLNQFIFVKRGDVICKKDDLAVVADRFSAKILWMSNNKINVNEKIILKLATQKTECIIEKIKQKIDSSSLELLEENAKELKEMEIGKVIIKTLKPVVIEKFSDIPGLGRFVLTQNSEICAGGIIV